MGIWTNEGFTKVLTARRSKASDIISAYGSKWKHQVSVSCGSSKRAVYVPILGNHVGSNTLLSVATSL